MLQGVFHRAGVAILLIVTLLLPFATCQPPARAANHDCCAHHSAPAASLKASCCLVHSDLPAIVVERTAVNALDFAQPAPNVLSLTPAMPVDTREATIIALYSPPPGKSILRI